MRIWLLTGIAKSTKSRVAVSRLIAVLHSTAMGVAEWFVRYIVLGAFPLFTLVYQVVNVLNIGKAA